MDEEVARGIAHYSHTGQRDRWGELIVAHVARVAAAVPAEAQALAWLHDVLERSATTPEELRKQGLSPDELEALQLLTRQDGESYELHALRIAYAAGVGGRLARLVKLADLDDHIARPWTSGDPPYGWARRHIEAAEVWTGYSSSSPSRPARATASDREDASSLR